MKDYLPGKKLLFVLFVVCIFSAAITFAVIAFDLQPKAFNDAKTIDNLPVSVKWQQDLRLGVFAKFKFVDNDLNSSKWQSYKVYVDAELLSVLTDAEKEKLSDLIKGSKYSTFPGKDLTAINQPSYPANTVVIAPYFKANMAVKALRIDGKHLFREDYEFSLPLNREATTSGFENIEAAIAVAKDDTAQAIGAKNASSLTFSPEDTNRFFMGGEIIPARAVDRLFLNSTNNYTFLFDRFAEDMQTADLTLALLENPISGDPKPCTGCTTFVGDARNAQGFKSVGIDLLGFGNHAGDGGLASIVETEKLLNGAGIGFTGVSSKNLNDASRLVTREVQSTTGGTKKIGFISADDVAWFYWAGETRWGTNRFSIRNNNGTFTVDQARIKTVISNAKQQVDYLIVMQSWGVEYTDTANLHQQTMAHAFVDAGADLVVASHPHWVQNFEIYNGKPIFYSLGNFIFDQTHTEPTRQGIVVNAYYYAGELKSFEVIPHLTCGYHQSNTNLTGKVINKEMSYAQVDAMNERQGCIYFQPKPLSQDNAVYKAIWERFIKSTKV